MVGWDGIEPSTPGFSVLRPSSNWPYAGVLPVPGLETPANAVGHIARAEVRPGAAEEPGAGQNVEPRLLVAQIHEGPRLAWLGAKEAPGRAILAPGHVGRDVAGSYRKACRHPREQDFS